MSFALLCVASSVFAAGLSNSQVPTGLSIQFDGPVPQGHIAVIAGTTLKIDANTSASENIRYSFDPAGDSIGYFDGDSFVATRTGTGRIIATDGESRGQSALITVSPAQLSEILLTISVIQVVGHPLVGTAKFVLLDQFNNLLIDYNLATDPITLVCGGGALSPSVVSDTLLFDSGVVDFLPMGMTYSGQSARRGIYATNGTISSNEVVVSFNGYDVHNALDLLGNTVSTIYSGLKTDVRAVLSNGGDQVASQKPQVKAYFASGNSGSVKKLFDPHAGDYPDTVSINLSTDALVPGADTLILECDSKYTIGDSTLSTISYAKFPVAVLPPVSISLVSGSLQPDSVYAGIPFAAGLDLKLTGVQLPVDSTRLVLGLSASINGPLLTTIFSGMPSALTVNDSLLRYSGLSSSVNPSDVVSGSLYLFRAGVTVYTGGNKVTLDSAYSEGLTILAPAAISVDTGSVAPSFVVERDEKQFAFDIVVLGTKPLIVDPATASFRVQTSGFSNSRSIIIENNVLNPGINHVTTQKIIFPSVIAGTFLSLSATFDYQQPGADNKQTYSTNFSGKTIYVRPRPVVLITSTKAFSQNAPHVNTGQSFHIDVVVQTTAEVDNLLVRLRSEGNSKFQGDAVVPHILAYDSAIVQFMIIADTATTAAEVFTSEIGTPEVDIEQALDNVEIVTIERPAELTFTHSLVGTVNGVVAPRSNFGLNLQLTNAGTAPISPGIFTFTSGGVPLGLADPLLDTIDDRSPISYELTAPNFDTAVQIQLQFTQLPIDSNTGLPATINATGFTSTIFVSKLDTRLHADVASLGSGVVTGGEDKTLATVTLSLAGTSTLAGVRVQDMTLALSDRDGHPISARDVFVIGNTSVYNDGVKVSQTTSGNDAIKFNFADLVVTTAQPLELTIRGLLQSQLPKGIIIRALASGIHASYDSGPLMGQPIDVEGPDGNDLLFELPLEVTGATLAGSLVVRDNPYNPDTGPAEFRFLSTDPDGIRFQVFTLDGQLVYEVEKAIVHAENSGEPFEQVLWDGRNASGDYVRNGVYLVVVTGKKTLEQAILKLAVVR